MEIISQGGRARNIFYSIRSNSPHPVFESIFWCMVPLLFFYSNWDLFVFYLFESRDIQRARDLLEGRFIFHGPELSGGGNLPGPSYYFLKAAVLWIHDTWEALAHFLFFSSALSLGLFSFWMRKVLGFASAMIFLGTLLGPGYYFSTLRFFNNPSFLTPFIVFLLVLLWQQPRREGHKKVLFLGLYFFLAAVALQYHMQMAIFFLFPFLVEAQFHRPIRPRIHLATLGIGFLGVVPALAPFFLWGGGVSSNEGIESAAAGSLFNAPIFLLESFYFKGQYLLKRAAVIPTAELYDWFSLRRSLQYLLAVGPFLYWYIYLVRNYKKEGNHLDRWIRVVFQGWLVLVPFGSYYLITSLAQRYGMVFFIINSLGLALVYSRLELSDKRRFSFVLLGTVCAWAALSWHRALPMAFSTPSLVIPALLPLLPFAAAALLCRHFPKWQALLIAGVIALPLINFLFGRIHEEDPSDNLSSGHLRKISQAMIARTGWSWELARTRIFLIGVHYETELQEIYMLEYERWKASKVPPSIGEVPDGFFVKAEKFAPDGDSGNLRGIGLESRMEDEIARGGIELRPLAKVKTVSLLEYHVHSQSFPKHFHNLGLGYSSSELEKKYARHLAKAPEAERLSNGEFVARWNDCLAKERYCASAIRMRVVPKGKELLEVQLLVLGRPLSVPSQWIMPNFTQSLKDLSVLVECHNGTYRKEFPSRIGFYSVEAGRLKSYVLAPLEYSFEVGCKGAPRKVKVAWPSSTVVQRIRTGDIPGHEFVFEFGAPGERRHL